MKRRVIWIHLSLTVLLIMALFMDHITVDGSPASELWRPELMDELTLDEWPIGEDDTFSNEDSAPMDMDENIYEMEALLAERNEQTAIDGINIKDGMNAHEDEDEEEEEEEDDVDQDDYEEEEEEDSHYDTVKAANQDNTDLLERFESHRSFDSNSDGNNKGKLVLIPAASSSSSSTSSSPKATSKLQQQEEQALEVLDQSILDILRMALDTVKQDRPQRFIPLDEIITPGVPITTDAPVETQTSTSTSSSSSSISLFLTSVIHVSVSWSSYWILGILLSLITLSYRRFRQQPIRDYHHLPSYSVYKQKSSVD